MKSKRGDISIMILIIGVVAVCGMAILSFIISNKFGSQNDELGVELVEKMNANIEKFEFYVNFAGKTNSEAVNLIGAKLVKGKIEERSEDDSVVVRYKLTP